MTYVKLCIRVCAIIPYATAFPANVHPKSYDRNLFHLSIENDAFYGNAKMLAFISHISRVIFLIKQI